MPESPPKTPPQQQEEQERQSEELNTPNPTPIPDSEENPNPVPDSEENPNPISEIEENPIPISEIEENPNPISEIEENPSQKSQPSTPQPQNPVAESTIVDEVQPEKESEFVGDEQDQHDDNDPEPEHEPEPEPENSESEGMNVTQSPISNATMLSEIKSTNKNDSTATSVRRTTKRKNRKGNKNHMSKVVVERRMQQLLQGFNPIPFVPGKSLDFAKYEEYLRKLGLWDFAHVEFDRDIRVDLIGKLIVSYNPKNRGGYVNELKIGVSRADLGRALKLPVLPPKKLDCDVDEFPQEFLSFLEEFVSNWMLLHEDVWVTPEEVLSWMKLIQEGNPQKVDWAGLIWYMVEKELSQRLSLKECYYASHLQQLMKMQREEMFLEGPNVEVEVPEVEVGNSKETVAVDDDEDGGDVKMMDAEESGQKLEEQSVELTLGQDYVAQGENGGDADKVEKDSDECHANEVEKVEDDAKPEEEDGVGIPESVDEDSKVESMENSEHVDNVVDAEIPVDENIQNKDVGMMDFGDYKEEQEQGQWFLDGKIGGQHFLQRCSMADMKVSDDRRLEGVGEDVEDDEVEEDGHVEGFKIMSKGPLDGMASANLMQAFETGQLPYSSTELGSQSSLELMSSRPDNNMMLSGPSMFNHAGKRAIDHEHDVAHHGLNDNHKRMRVDGNWDDKPPEFDLCMEQIQQWVEKAKICHMAATDDVYQQTSMAQQFYAQQVAEKDSEIMQLRYKLDDLQRNKQVEVDRLNRELYLMNSVIDGYRRALKQNQKTFAEYRKRCQVTDEPIYKDTGLRGVVKSVTELERERLKKEEENKIMRNVIEETFRRNCNDCEVKWDSEIVLKVQFLQNRLMDAVKEVELLKDNHLKLKTSTNIPNEPENPSE